MKKILSFVILVVALSSCSEDVKFNNEAVFQGVINNSFWQGANAKAIVDTDNNVLTVQAVSLTELMKLEMPVPPTTINPRDKSTFVTYILGTSDTKTAYYIVTINGIPAEYQTAIGVGDGQIVVTEYDGVTVSGTFRFNANSTEPDSDDVLNVQSGTFYKVPVYQTL